MTQLLSSTAMSCLYTMGVASNKDTRQSVPDKYTIPNQATRLLRARLILEEALETVKALGFDVEANTQNRTIVSIDDASFYPNKEALQIDTIIDGCCDTIYVATGCLCAMGVPDLPHLNEVNACNNKKFPKGKAITDSNGKYLKPHGWVPPNHDGVYSIYTQTVKLGVISKELVSTASA